MAPRRPAHQSTDFFETPGAPGPPRGFEWNALVRRFRTIGPAGRRLGPSWLRLILGAALALSFAGAIWVVATSATREQNRVEAQASAWRDQLAGRAIPASAQAWLTANPGSNAMDAILDEVEVIERSFSSKGAGGIRKIELDYRESLNKDTASLMHIVREQFVAEQDLLLFDLAQPEFLEVLRAHRDANAKVLDRIAHFGERHEDAWSTWDIGTRNREPRDFQGRLDVLLPIQMYLAVEEGRPQEAHEALLDWWVLLKAFQRHRSLENGRTGLWGEWHLYGELLCLMKAAPPSRRQTERYLALVQPERTLEEFARLVREDRLNAAAILWKEPCPVDLSLRPRLQAHLAQWEARGRERALAELRGGAEGLAYLLTYEKALWETHGAEDWDSLTQEWEKTASPSRTAPAQLISLATQSSVDPMREAIHTRRMANSGSLVRAALLLRLAELDSPPGSPPPASLNDLARRHGFPPLVDYLTAEPRQPLEYTAGRQSWMVRHALDPLDEEEPLLENSASWNPGA
ncbi:MAG: hypothetical protein RLY93_19920 [Sumerlaeia bacterium]